MIGSNAHDADGRFAQSPIGPSEHEVSCTQFAEQLAHYTSGRLEERHAQSLEWHAAHCAHCEPLMQQASPAPSFAATTDTLARAVPLSDVERQQLRVLVVPPPTRRPWLARGRTGLAIAAVAAAVVLTVVRNRPASTPAQFGRSPLAGNAQNADSLVDTDPMPASVGGSAPMRTAVRLARANASPEFVALAAATSEIDRAMARAPGNTALRELRLALDDRRRELESRVARVTE